MPTLICDLRPGAAAWAGEYERLRQAGEPLVLFWPGAARCEGMAAVHGAGELEAAFDDERMAGIIGSGSLPAWLNMDEFDRVFLRSNADARALPDAEAALVASLYAAGAESVELLSDAAAESLSQSWHSGRRTGTLELRKQD